MTPIPVYFISEYVSPNLMRHNSIFPDPIRNSLPEVGIDMREERCLPLPDILALRTAEVTDDVAKKM